MTPVTSVALQTDIQRPQTTARPLRPATGATYSLTQGLQIIPTKGGGVLLSLQPLMAMRFNALGVAVLSALSSSHGRTAAEVAERVPALSPVDAARFLDDLARRHVLTWEPPAPPAWPFVSVIIAAHGRPAATRACVQSLLTQDYPRDRFEIIVIDDASDPPLAPVPAGLPVRLRRLERNVGQSAARNLAAVEATGDVLAFIDNDCVAAPSWLTDLVPYVLHDPAPALVGGRVVAPPPAGAVSAYEAVRSPLDMGPVSGPVGPREAVAYLPTCNLVMRRDVMLGIRGFAVPMRVGEDVDLIWRSLETGERAHYVHDRGIITHDHRVRLMAMLRRRADYGASEAELQRRHPQHPSTLHLPKVSLLVLAGLAASSVSWPVAAALVSLIPVLILTELMAKHRHLRGLGLNLGVRRLLASVLRAHAASLYHFGHHVTRYYSIPLTAASLLWPPLLPVAAILMLVPPVWDHRRLKPALGLPTFLGLYGLEMAAYQVGVWRGCLARRCWRPLCPQIRWRR